MLRPTVRLEKAFQPRPSGRAPQAAKALRDEQAGSMPIILETAVDRFASLARPHEIER
ncbi:hypothetical protein [Ramlibacter sp. H39-3-26]|uniref:hypothetical protein n=1 Tax=Curvibacter soli TaxID=3031331 RepID=UPI0023D992CE|nr:hypothetical protein [Ramlibacter sp. H39-3-26]